MKSWQEFMPDILPDVYGCPDPTVVLALRRVSRQFFEQTRIWRLWMDPVSIKLGVVNYDLDLEVQSELVNIERATLNGAALEVTNSEALGSGWRIQNQAYGPCVFTEDRKTFNFLPALVTGDLVQLEVTLKPSSNAVGIVDAYFDQYAETLATGAKARLMQQPNKPYSNPNLGMLLEQQFNNAITDVNIRRAHGFSSSPLTVRPRSFASNTRSNTWL